MSPPPEPTEPQAEEPVEEPADARVEARVEALLRELAPQVLGALVRRHGDFDTCEDAVQEALLDAALQWPQRGVPDNPRGWLVTVASRRLIDQVRSDSARRRREESVAVRETAPEEPPAHDDTLRLLFLCCHPDLPQASQLALTLRAVGGLTTAEIARAFLVPEATMAQRISRAKQKIKGTAFGEPGEPAVVLHVLYLIFNEGYTASSGPELHRGELTGEAIRLARAVHRLLPGDGEAAGLLALMLLTEARRPARTGPEGVLVPLEEQDRALWDQPMIAEGVGLITAALQQAAPGPYQVQAAIAAVHDEAPSWEQTDWPQVLALYGLLADSPVVRLNRAVALAMVQGPKAGLALLDTLEGGELSGHHRLAAVRAHLLELDGQALAAREHYLTAAGLTSSLPEQGYLRARAERLIVT
ncbi:RNA polymerase sigma factor [Nonomuraea soli]|uniref:RNA polymerase sigma factor (Sigma-70 family) n=1 Tax=Nonomuraea soli TaxID=1032476 RepID=A0A7W0CSD8_9ACTN|nr:sigma-70 family RNA polymerase sigma factor [Nonomuraea soli]MBA2896446.1 RNA polymerase sigma factor (sigma-70 family) [Nonomuraea soli]